MSAAQQAEHAHQEAGGACAFALSQTVSSQQPLGEQGMASLSISFTQLWTCRTPLWDPPLLLMATSGWAAHRRPSWDRTMATCPP